MLVEDLMALASLAGNTVVAAAATDAWEAARRKFARLLGRGGPKQEQLTEQRLEETRQQLTGAAGTDLEQARAALAERWAGRLADLLEEDPGAEAELRALVQEIQAALPAGIVSAGDHAVAAGRDVSICATGGGVAAGVIHGNVAPYTAGPGGRLAGPGIGIAERGAIVAVQGGVAVGQLAYQRAAMAGQPVRLAPRPVFLAGREVLLGELDTRLSGSADSGLRTVVLCGLGGAGKTSMAVEYAHRHLAEVGVAWQLAAEDPAVLTAGLGELAAQLGAQDVLDTRDPVATVHGVLAKYPADWLLVFDNAADWTSVAAFLPPAGPGRVLITSQNQNWPTGQALDVPVLDPEVAAEFLVNRTGRSDRQAAGELAVALGGLPLALEQASAYIVASGDSLAGYLASFRQRRADLLSRGEPTGYPRTVATTWALAFERLQHASPEAVGLLRLLAFCAPEAFPLGLLLQSRPGLAGQLGHEVVQVLAPLLEDPLAAKDAIVALRRYSLVTPTADGSVSVHRLVQAITVDQMPADVAGQWRQAAAAVIEAAIPADADQPETWPVFAALLPHVQAALANDSEGMERIADYLGVSGNFGAARAVHQQVLDAALQSLGAEHPRTLIHRANLAFWTGRAGDPAGARDQYAALLPVTERIFGPESTQALTERANLAAWTGQAGDVAGARDQLVALLPVRERVSGPEDPHTLAVRGNVAYWTGRAGNVVSARDQLAALLPIMRRVQGAEAPDTLVNEAELARFTGEAGDVVGARDQLAALLRVTERVLGAEHPDTLKEIRANLARFTGEAGDPAGARDQLAALLPVTERVLGAEHPDTLKIRANLARFTGETGDPAGARDQLAELLAVRERVSGPQHPYTLTVRVNLAYWTEKAGGPGSGVN